MKKKFQEMHRAKRAELSKILATAAAENRAPNAEELKQITALNSEIAGLEVAIETASDAEIKDQEIAAAAAQAAATAAGGPSDAPVAPAAQNTASGAPAAQQAGAPHVQAPVLGQKASQPFDSLADQLKAIHGTEYGRADNRLEMVRAAATGGSVNSAPDGGYLIQSNFSDKIISTAIDGAAIMSEVTKFPLKNGNQLVLPMVKDKDCSGGSIRAGIKAYLSDEAETVTKSKPQFERFELSLRKISVVAWATDELLEDFDAYETYIMANVPDQLGFQVDEEILFGEGSKGPKGIFNSASLITVPKVSGQAADTVVAQNIIDMCSRMWSKSKRKKFYYTKQLETQFPGLFLPTGTNAGALIYTPPGGIVAAPNGYLLGVTAKECPNLVAPGDVGDILLADFAEYMFIDKGGIKGNSSIHVEFLKGEKVFKWDYRMNGAPGWQQAHTPPKNSTHTQSPFITLAARA